MEAKPQPEQLAWGGIGGSGKHAPQFIAELLRDPQVQEALARMPQQAWGGIGGSGRHAQELEPEVEQKQS